MDKTVELHLGVPRSGTWRISKGFNRDHHRLMDLIEKHKARFLRLENNSVSTALIIRRVPIKTAGRPVNEIMLNEQQAIFLGTLFRNTEKVLDFKERLAKGFVRQRNVIASLVFQRRNAGWQKARSDGKLVYRKKTDVIKKFIEYCEAAGSKRAATYYANLAKMENSSLFFLEQHYKNVREVLNVMQLNQICVADRVIDKALIEGMAKKMNYHDIFKLAKERVISLAEIIGKSPVIELLEETKEIQ